jgi:putative DNA primase/helicase
MQFAEFTDQYLHNRKPLGKGFTARCPAHDDRENSLSVNPGRDGGILVKCHAGCKTEEVVREMGLEMADLMPEDSKPAKSKRKPFKVLEKYPYKDERGELLYEVLRLEPKSFRQCQPDPNNPEGRIFNLQGVRRILYHLPQLLEGIREGRPVFIAEGERDVHTLESLDFIATTNAGGAAKWSPDFSKVLREAPEVFILPDNDGPGQAHAQKVAAEVPGAVIVALPGLPPKGDISDWVAQGGTREDLIKICEAAREAQRTAPKTEPEAPAMAAMLTGSPDELRATVLSESASADRFAGLHAERYRFRAGLGDLTYTGTHWQRCETDPIHLVRPVADDVFGEFEALNRADYVEERIARAYWRTIRELRSAQGACNVLRLARAHPDLCGAHDWDGDPDLLNVTNGTLNLRTGELQPHSPADHITGCAPFEFDPDATCPTWERFIAEVACEDGELVRYLTWVCGYALTGHTGAEVFFALHGNGANGKSTFVEVLLALAGAFGRKVPGDLLLQNRGDAHPTALASLAGARVAVASEFAPDQRFNAAMLKEIVSGETQTARLMRRDFFSFRPTAKLLITTNALPAVHDDSEGFWRRARVIPFNASIPPERRDPQLKGKLLDEAPGIVSWAMRAWQACPDREPTIPHAVAEASRRYRVSNDPLGEFLESECVIETGARVLKSDFRAALHERFGDHAPKDREVFRAMVGRFGLRDIRSNGRQFWVGVRLQ